MKRTLLLSSALALGGLWLGLAQAEIRTDLIGEPAPPTAAATRTIEIQPGTRWVNVTGGEVVKFVVGDKSFVWSFDGTPTSAGFNLNQIAPEGVLDHPVQGYLAPNPLYTN